MRLIRRLSFPILYLCAFLGSSIGQQKPLSVQKPASSEGRSAFNSACAGCHGLDGRGSDKAFNIAENPKVRNLSDVELSSVISKGVPGTGMPAFRTFNERKLRALVGYLRSLQGKNEARAAHGDAARGKAVFFGKGNCSSCHTISGQGGFLGPDLTDYGATTSADGIREAVVRSPRVVTHGYRMAVATTANGDRLEGLVRNEDNFSIQLQTKEGSFHLLQKAELKGLEALDGSLMPANYRSQLTDAELNDLVSYLMKTPDPTKASTLPRKKDDVE